MHFTKIFVKLSLLSYNFVALSILYFSFCSKLCNCCHHKIEPFMIRKSHKPNDIKLNKKITVNGLLSHQEDKQKCEIIHNRDKNAVQNMLNIVKSIFTIGKRPDIFTRIHT